jgi:protein SCO1/2
VRSTRALVLAVLVPLLLVLAGCGSSTPASSAGPVSGFSDGDTDGLHGIVLPHPYRVPGVALRDTAGHRFDLAADATAPLTLVFFGYTHCPDVCQVVMANLANALVRLRPAQRTKVHMVFVTTDPARDTEQVLRSYLDRFDPTFEGATGTLPAVVRAGKAFGVEIAKGKKLASGGYDVAHGTPVLGLLPDGRAPFVWTEPTDPGDLAEDVTTILDDKVPGL